MSNASNAIIRRLAALAVVATAIVGVSGLSTVSRPGAARVAASGGCCLK
jgi:hypothetical protein